MMPHSRRLGHGDDGEGVGTVLGDDDEETGIGI